MKRYAQSLRRFLTSSGLTPAAGAERDRDRTGAPRGDVDPSRALEEAVAWLARAQDGSRTHDGGLARHYSLIGGWSASYPETTGYIVPTLLDYARARPGPAADDARGRARRMLDWLVAIQLPCGGFQGGTIDQTPVVPVTFNTGQVLLGLAAGVSDFGAMYRDALSRAAGWLVATQDADGCWRRHPTPFASPGEKTYETHVAWGLLEADRVAPDPSYHRAAMANIRWALTWQRPNGWFDRCCLQDTSAPLTHTLGYALRGVLEGYRATGESALLEAARRTADGALGALAANGFLPGRLDDRWQAAVPWSCLTGGAQFAACWRLLASTTREPHYEDAARRALAFVRRTIDLAGPPEVRGAVKGSFPVDGGYCPYEYPNWACKFFIDAQLMERNALEPE